MKIVLTGGGSGGHFYPLMAVAAELHTYADQHNLTRPELFYISDTPYDPGALAEHGITYRHVDAGKLRVYSSMRNITDMLKLIVGLPTALHLMFKIWPDVVFSKGGYAAMPVVIAARILRIPIFIHDSDSIPGRASLWAGKFAERIAISYPGAAQYFTHKERIAYTGNPIRRELLIPVSHDVREEFRIMSTAPVLLVLGGSQGADAINTAILKGIREILQTFEVIHQTGPNNFKQCTDFVDLELDDDVKARYHSFPSLTVQQMRSAAHAADLIISRAGSGAIYEIAAWEKPSIIIPIPEGVSRDQKENAYTYARSGGCEVIEQENCTAHVLVNEAVRILSDAAVMEAMRVGARSFKKTDAARILAEEIMRITLSHER